jgi:hypothetical protein
MGDLSRVGRKKMIKKAPNTAMKFTDDIVQIPISKEVADILEKISKNPISMDIILGGDDAIVFILKNEAPKETQNEQ